MNKVKQLADSSVCMYVHTSVCMCIGWSKLAIPNSCVWLPSGASHGGYMQRASDKVSQIQPSPVPVTQVAMYSMHVLYVPSLRCIHTYVRMHIMPVYGLRFNPDIVAVMTVCYCLCNMF